MRPLIKPKKKKKKKKKKKNLQRKSKSTKKINIEFVATEYAKVFIQRMNKNDHSPASVLITEEDFPKE